MFSKCLPNSLSVDGVFRLIVSDSPCQIFHHASAIPGSRIHSWPVLVDNGIGFLSVRTRMDSIPRLLCNANQVYLGTPCIWE